MGSINEKNQRPKISCYCPFKEMQMNAIIEKVKEGKLAAAENQRYLNAKVSMVDITVKVEN